MDGAASTHLRRPCTGFMTMFRACGGHRITAQASGLDFMSIQRMTLAFHTISLDLRRFALPLRLAASLAGIAVPLSGCSSATETWDKVFSKDDTFVEEPAEKLYNEGLFLMNEKHSPKEASKKFEEVDRQHPYSDLARKSLLMSAYAFYNANDYDSCIGAATRYVALDPGSLASAYAQYPTAAHHDQP